MELLTRLPFVFCHYCESKLLAKNELQGNISMFIKSAKKQEKMHIF